MAEYRVQKAQKDEKLNQMTPFVAVLKSKTQQWPERNWLRFAKMCFFSENWRA